MLDHLSIKLVLFLFLHLDILSPLFGTLKESVQVSDDVLFYGSLDGSAVHQLTQILQFELYLAGTYLLEYKKEQN